MKAEGYGGPVSAGFDDSILDGVRSEDVHPAGAKSRQCKSRSCERWFISRQEGDMYCCEKCDTNTHPQYRGRRSYRDTDAANSSDEFGWNWNELPAWRDKKKND